MDLKQRKLSKSEWDSIEIPVSASELEILQLINDGFENVNICRNKTCSLFTYLKIEYDRQIEEYLYAKYFADKIKLLISKYNVEFILVSDNLKSRNRDKHDACTIVDNICTINVATIVKLKSSDQLRLSRLNCISDTNTTIYEFILFTTIENMLRNKRDNNNEWMFYYYTLNKLLQNNIDKLNIIIKTICDAFIINFECELSLLYIIQHASKFIEQNPDLLKYTDLSLYGHQREIFICAKIIRPKLILYIAPTGTGKTLSPLGISKSYKVIFVCAARHVGLALARSAISINKKIAFAFGCSSAEDVRLHYFAAKEYTVHKRSGQIRKVDNTVGDKVEIMICDIRSYITAMHYMLAFNSPESIITYWDEPTITLDYDTHELHTIIKQNWTQNIIPNVVLSSATLPKQHELTHTINDFQTKYPHSVIYNISSHDCTKTIPLMNNEGQIIMPHYLHSSYADVLDTVKQCEENLTLLRYLDLGETARFISYVEANEYNKSSSKCLRNFASINDIDMKSIKMYYLKILKNIKPDTWDSIYDYFKTNRIASIPINTSVDNKGNKIARTNQPSQTQTSTSAGLYVTTKDAHTLTDGATIFIAKDLTKIAKFCIQQSNIPATVMTDIMEKIEFNNQINERIANIDDELEAEEQRIANKLMGSSSDTSKEARNLGSKKDKKGKSKIANNLVNKSETSKIRKLREDLAILKTMIKRASLDDLFIPNKLAHKNKWAEQYSQSNSFTSDICDDTILAIMMLKDVLDSWKILLLLGIGVMTEHKNNAYTEIMKTLADNQQLYLIIAESDYIYGTNYQLCHGYLSKDLILTQEKIIQALGRIGRSNIQQQYSVRFRDDGHINMLFRNITSEEKPEVINMNLLFNSKNIKWNGTDYEEIAEVLTEDVVSQEEVV